MEDAVDRLLSGRLEVGEEVILVALGELLEFRKARGFVFGQIGGFPGILREVDQEVPGSLAPFPRGDLVERSVEQFPVPLAHGIIAGRPAPEEDAFGVTNRHSLLDWPTSGRASHLKRMPLALAASL